MGMYMWIFDSTDVVCYTNVFSLVYKGSLAFFLKKTIDKVWNIGWNPRLIK